MSAIRRYALILALLGVALGGCARPPATTPVAPAPAAVNAPAAPAASTSPLPSPAAAEPAAPTSREHPWRLPEGPLDDAKFIAISAKYAAATGRLTEKQRNSDEVMRLVLGAILKEGHVSLDEYTRYADQVGRDPQRKERLAAAILAMAKERGGKSVGGKPAAPSQAGGAAAPSPRAKDLETSF